MPHAAPSHRTTQPPTTTGVPASLSITAPPIAILPLAVPLIAVPPAIVEARGRKCKQTYSQAEQLHLFHVIGDVLPIGPDSTQEEGTH